MLSFVFAWTSGLVPTGLDGVVVETSTETTALIEAPRSGRVCSC